MNRKNNTNTDKQKIMLIKTNIGCFISDCYAISGYDYNYHHCQIKDLYFDGKKPNGTFYSNWLRINKYPEKIEKLCHGEYINKRYVIEDDKNITPNLPQIIPLYQCPHCNGSGYQGETVSINKRSEIEKINNK